jgi:hypothetical protein
MGFADIYKKTTEPHVDTPAQAKARADAAAEVKAKADAKTARAAAARAAKNAGQPPPTAKVPTK